jgi:hypothetical protein
MNWQFLRSHPISWLSNKSAISFPTPMDASLIRACPKSGCFSISFQAMTAPFEIPAARLQTLPFKTPQGPF